MSARYFDPVPALKRQVASEILALLDGWSQCYGGVLMGARQPRLSELRNGHLERYSLDRLVRMLTHLDRRVEITSTRRTERSVLDHSPLDGPVRVPQRRVRGEP